MENWTVEETTEWAITQFPDLPVEEAQQRFEDEEVDGKTLIMLANTGTVEQLKLCGFKTLKQQLLLRKLLVSSSSATPSSTPSAPAALSPGTSTGGKLTLSAMKTMSSEDKQLYLIKRRKVASAAHKMWPGNNIPTFKNNEVMLKQLDKLVKSLLPDCEMPFFGEQAIRRHILDSLTERRRQIKKGHNYENPLPSKKIKKECCDSKGKGKKELKKEMLFDFNENNNSDDEKDKTRTEEQYKSGEEINPESGNNEVIHPKEENKKKTDKENEKDKTRREEYKSGEEIDLESGNNEIIHPKEENKKKTDKENEKDKTRSEEQYKSGEEIDPEKVIHPKEENKKKTGKENKKDVDVRTKFTPKSTAAKVFADDDDDDDSDDNDEIDTGSESSGMSQESAKVITMCAFGAHSFKEISRGQLASAVKYFSKGTGRKVMLPKPADKYQLVSVLAPLLIERGEVAINDGADIENLSRNDITKKGNY